MIKSVIKIGGSLLDLPDLVLRLRTWLNNYENTPAWIICGGGEQAENIRARQPWMEWCDEEAHDLAVLAMDANTYEMSEMLGLTVAELVSTTPPKQCEKFTLIAVAPFLNSFEPHCDGPALPHNWSATSDSIAARIAHIFAIPTVVLLKSAEPANGNLGQLQEIGYIDAAFTSMLRADTDVEFANLRAT